MSNTFTPTAVENISGSEESALEAINNNFSRIAESLEESVSKTGGIVTSDLDINGQDINNADTINATSVTVGGQQIGVDSSLVVNIPFNIEGDWGLSNGYVLNDLVENNGSSYVCKLPHTSTSGDEPEVGGSWETYWEIVASKGDTGATGASGGGSGDLVASNNLTDVDSTVTSLFNLGGQPSSSLLTDISNATLAKGDILYYNGASIVNLGAGTAGEVLKTGGVGLDPSWGSASGVGGIIQRKFVNNYYFPTDTYFTGATDASPRSLIIKTFAVSDSTNEVWVSGVVSASNGSDGPDANGFKIELWVDDVEVSNYETYLTQNSYYSHPFNFQYIPGDTSSHVYKIRCWSTTPGASGTRMRTPGSFGVWEEVVR